MIVTVRMTIFITIMNFYLIFKTLTSVENIFWAGMVRESTAYEQRHVFQQTETCFSQAKNRIREKKKESVGGQMESKLLSHFLLLPHILQHWKNIKYLLWVQVSYVGPKLSLNRQNNGNITSRCFQPYVD